MLTNSDATSEVLNAPSVEADVPDVETVTRWSSKVVCRCLRVTENEICEAIVLGEIQTVKDLGRCTGAGQGCNACHSALRKYLAERRPA